MRAMRAVQARAVDPGRHETVEHPTWIGRGTERRHDLRPPFQHAHPIANRRDHPDTQLAQGRDALARTTPKHGPIATPVPMCTAWIPADDVNATRAGFSDISQ